MSGSGPSLRADRAQELAGRHLVARVLALLVSVERVRRPVVVFDVRRAWPLDAVESDGAVFDGGVRAGEQSEGMSGRGLGFETTPRYVETVHT